MWNRHLLDFTIDFIAQPKPKFVLKNKSLPLNTFNCIGRITLMYSCVPRAISSSAVYDAYIVFYNVNTTWPWNTWTSSNVWYKSSSIDFWTVDMYRNRYYYYYNSVGIFNEEPVDIKTYIIKRSEPVIINCIIIITVNNHRHALCANSKYKISVPIHRCITP